MATQQQAATTAPLERIVRRAFVAGIWFHDLQTSRLTKFGDCREVMRTVLSFATWFDNDEWGDAWICDAQKKLLAVVEQDHRHLGEDPTLIPELFDCLMECLQAPI